MFFLLKISLIRWACLATCHNNSVYGLMADKIFLPFQVQSRNGFQKSAKLKKNEKATHILMS